MTERIPLAAHVLALACLSILFAPAASKGQQIVWQRHLGGSLDDVPERLIPLADGGTLLVGATSSSNQDISDFRGAVDAWLMRLDAAGNTLWSRCYGGLDLDHAFDALEVEEGFVFVATTRSNSIDVSGNQGIGDAWVVKVDGNGDLIWQRTYGGPGDDGARRIMRTADNGFLVMGYACALGGNVSSLAGGQDIWVLKLDENGELLWQRTYGGPGFDQGYGLAQAADGSFVIAGMCSANGGAVSGNHGLWDAWVLQIDGSGLPEWTHSLGGSNYDCSFDILAVSEGYLVAGYSQSTNGDVSLNRGGADVWVVKLGLSGDLDWEKTYGGSDWDVALTLFPVTGGYVVLGTTASSDGDITQQNGNQDVWALRIDGQGELLAQRTYGGSNYDEGRCGYERADGSIMMAAMSMSSNGDLPGNHGQFDAWLFRVEGLVAIGEVGVSAFALFPNPASDVLWVNTGAWEAERCAVIANDGRRMLEHNVARGVAAGLPIPLNTLPAGPYVLMLTGRDGTMRSSVFMKE